MGHQFPLGNQLVTVTVSGELATELKPNVAGDSIQVSVKIEEKSTNSGTNICNYSITSGYYINSEYHNENRLGVNSFGEASFEFSVPAPGVYSVFLRGEAQCNDYAAKTPSLAFSIYKFDVKTPEFRVIKEMVPAPLKISKVTCSPQFKISLSKEYSYTCISTIVDKSHVADVFSMSPAPATYLYSGRVNSRSTSKSWKRTSTGWIITSKFRLLTVSPADYAKYRAIEYFQIGAMVQDLSLGLKEDFNRLAESAVLIPVFAFTKVTK